MGNTNVDRQGCPLGEIDRKANFLPPTGRAPMYCAQQISAATADPAIGLSLKPA